MVNFAALPPEVNSGRMYAGAGSGPLLSASAAWERLAGELSSAASSYSSVVSELVSGPWLGPTAAAMAAAVAPYVSWLSSTAEQADQTADQAKSAAAAYSAAFAGTVPPQVIAENRTLLASLLLTNVFGQNSAAIAATEMHYAEMWAQDAAAMYGYADASAAATSLKPFRPAPQTTNPTGVSGQAAAVGQAAGTAFATQSQTVSSQTMSAVPSLLHALASGAPGGSTAGLGNLVNSVAGTGSSGMLGTLGNILDFASGETFIGSGILFILQPLFEAPTIAALGPAGALGLSGGGLSAGFVGAAIPAGLSGAGMSAAVGGTAVLTDLGRGASIGGLSVPQGWVQAAPAITPAARALPQVALAGFSQAEPDWQQPALGGMLPAGLMTAAAAGGGATGGSLAAQRGSGAAQRADGANTRFGSRPAVVPQLARAGGLPEDTRGHGFSPVHHPRDGADLTSESVREELNYLRKQLAELAMERDVLIRSAALFAKEAIGRGE
jgi:PPE-repeat protein